MTVKLYLPHILLFFICFSLSETTEFSCPAVFNFGDSNSDTGNLVAGIGQPLGLPYGKNYFGQPSGRVCDGRLTIDFLMDAMKLPFLNAYLNSVGAPSFRRGCNFAADGSTILPATASAFCPFSFGIQVNQFLQFMERVQTLLAKGKTLDSFLPPEEYFKQGLYMFDIGQNDLSQAFHSDQSLAFNLIPYILSEFETGITKLYDQGARRFWIHNTGPLGCLPDNLATFGRDPSKLDEHGCVTMHNRAARLFNLQLHALCGRLPGQFRDASITYTDIFTIKLDLIANYSRYGFEEPTMACCGYGGPPLNYDNQILCGTTRNLNGTLVTAKGCEDSSKYVIWDGIHYTEAANQHVSSQILTGKYSYTSFADGRSDLRYGAQVVQK